MSASLKQETLPTGQVESREYTFLTAQKYKLSYTQVFKKCFLCVNSFRIVLKLYLITIKRFLRSLHLSRSCHLLQVYKLKFFFNSEKYK